MAPNRDRVKANTKKGGRTPSVWAATRKGLFRVAKGAGGWRIADVHFLGDPVAIVHADPRDGAVYAVIDHGHFGIKMHRSPDGGRTWTEIGVPAYPERPATATDVDAFSKKPREWKLKGIWALAAGHASQPGRVWCGTTPGGLFRSDDHGATWTLVRPLWDHPKRAEWFGGGTEVPALHSICVDPRDGNRVTVGVSCGGVWATRDGGASWDCRATGMWAAYLPPESKGDPNLQDPHCVVQCRGAPDYFWAQHHNGVFRTTDGCASWREVKAAKPSAFGFAVAVHPRDPDTAWFVPAVKDERRVPVDGKVVVSRTRDGGKSFQVLRKGLPQAHAYDLTFRHALDIDASGTRLAFGSTTGGLWVSENQGDAWTEVSSHLPPVYCVRFG